MGIFFRMAFQTLPLSCLRAVRLGWCGGDFNPHRLNMPIFLLRFGKLLLLTPFVLLSMKHKPEAPSRFCAPMALNLCWSKAGLLAGTIQPKDSGPTATLISASEHRSIRKQ